MYIEKTESYELHQPDEWYSGVIVGVEENQYGDNEPSFKFLIELDGEERDTWLFTSQKYSDFPSKLWKLAEDTTGRGHRNRVTSSSELEMVLVMLPDL